MIPYNYILLFQLEKKHNVRRMTSHHCSNSPQIHYYPPIAHNPKGTNNHLVVRLRKRTLEHQTFGKKQIMDVQIIIMK